MRRKVTCGCGDTMFARNDEELFHVVRRHVDDYHADKRYSDQDIQKLIAGEAEDA
jgi:predicted small metal-binding protein